MRTTLQCFLIIQMPNSKFIYLILGTKVFCLGQAGDLKSI